MKVKFVILTFAVLVLLTANIFFGAIHISPMEVWNVLTGKTDMNDPIGFIILGSRVPQALTALLGGAALGVAGLLLQTAFRNPLAGPSILGISSGASLGVALVMLFMGGSLAVGDWTWSGYSAIVVGALAGSILIMGILISLSAIVRNELMLLIAGILIGYLTSSIVTLLSSAATAQRIQGFVIWGMGSFGDVSLRQLPLFSFITMIGLLMAMTLAKPLNLLLLGDSYARNLGVRIVPVRNLLLLATGILTAVVTAYCGPVGFIGMAVPHLSRMFFHTDNHWVLLPSTMLWGGIMALACNVCSTIPESTVLPINALTPVIGVPIILYVILRRK